MFAFAAWTLGAPADSQGSASPGIWATQDGSVLVEGEAVSFPFLPFLGLEPAWSPALPQYYGQPVEPVRPLLGLGGRVTVGLSREGGGAIEPFSLRVEESSPHSGTIELSGPGASLKLRLQTALGMKGVLFELDGMGKPIPPLTFAVEGSPHRLLWAEPGKKVRRDWGSSRWDWEAEEVCLIHSHSTPVDATLSMTTGLWFPDEVRAEPVIETDPDGIGNPRIEIRIDPGGRESFRFGFLHADNRAGFETELAGVRSTPLPEARGSWERFAEECRAAIARTAMARATAEVRLSPSDREVVDRITLQTRGLFLSNGMVLSSPMTPGEFPYSLRDQGTALAFWNRLGLQNPYAERWRDLVQFHPASERTIPITPFRGEDVRSVLRSGSFPVVAPDPADPPTREAFDILLGYIIDGGKVTLVDGSFGFSGREGWWTEAGAADPADYAVRVLGVPVDVDSRTVLDEAGVSPLKNTFTLGTTPLEPSLTPEGRVRVSPPGEGHVFVAARDASDPVGVRLREGKIGDREFRALTASEDEILSASFQPEIAWSDRGGTVGRLLRGEGFAAYATPKAASYSCEFDIEGEAAFHWSAELPTLEHRLLKKVVLAWYQSALIDFPVSRIAHPVVYSGTYTCRVFDVADTETSPVLFHKVGLGSFAWIGLPVESIRLGSDRGSDAQCSLREDPGYDLVRLTLALHDPRQAGAQQAGMAPRLVWTDRLNVRDASPPRPDLAVHAWESIRQLGPAAGNRTFWGWAFANFSSALRAPVWDRREVAGTSLFAVPAAEPDSRVDLYHHACAHALYRDIEGAAGNLDRDWQNEAARNRADGIENDLSEHLRFASPTPWAARYVRDGTLAQEASLESVYDETLLATALFEGDRFPGGESAREKFLRMLVAAPPENPTPATLALLAVVDETNRGAHLERIEALNRGEAPPSVLIPSLLGLILDRSSPNRG